MIINKEVEKAIKEGRPVVALESTIISHGMPYPQNVETALRVEKVIEDNGAVPATIAIINGTAKVGLSHEEIEYLGKEGPKVIKTSRRDIPYVMSKGLNGATTVASTMILAAKAGVKIFATGGIGGVHRGAQDSMDISADLDELSKTDVNVICAGCKSILDIGRTLEYLETKGVAVVGVGTDIMPAFYTSKSDFRTAMRLDTPEEFARFIKAKSDFGLGCGMVIANPIPEEYEMPRDVIDKAIDQAIAESRQQGILGKNITPFLLARVKDLTGGDSLESNINLVLNNARLGAQIAVELSKLDQAR